MKSISILIPTLNSGHVLGPCLESIAGQEYPRESLEIIIADGGSTDNTLEIARQYTENIFHNPLRTGEAGKAVALQHAKGEVIAFIDSDNVLPQADWFSRMAEPFQDAEIVGAEPIEYTWRRQDGFITRYCALMGMNDPLCLFLGNYDRLNAISGKWTEMPVVQQDQGSYLKIMLDERRLPTIGANGFLIRRAVLAGCSVQDYIFDIDVIYELSQQGHDKFAKVKIGIVHTFSGNVETFFRKQTRRIRDYVFYSQSSLRKYPWQKTSKLRPAKFVIYCITVLPLVVQMAVGFRHKPDRAWLFHPLACWITLLVYAYGTVSGRLAPKPQDRAAWSQ